MTQIRHLALARLPPSITDAEVFSRFVSSKLRLGEDESVYAIDLKLGQREVTEEMFQSICEVTMFERGKIQKALDKIDVDREITSGECKLFIYQVCRDAGRLWVADVGVWHANFESLVFVPNALLTHHQETDSDQTSLASEPIGASATSLALQAPVPTPAPTVVIMPLYIPHTKDRPPAGTTIDMKTCMEICQLYYLYLSDDEPVLLPTKETCDYILPTREQEMFAVLFMLASTCKNYPQSNFLVNALVAFYKRCILADATLLRRIRMGHRHYANCGTMDVFLGTLRAQLTQISQTFKANYDKFPLVMRGFLF